MKGETALGVLAVLTIGFILVFLLVTSGAGGEMNVSAENGGTAATTPSPTAVPTTLAPQGTLATITPSEAPTTPLPAHTSTEEPADPVVGRWIADSSSELVLYSNGNGTLTEGNSTHAATWKTDRDPGIAGTRAYRLSVPGHAESILYLRNMSGTLSRKGPGTDLTYTRSP